MSTCTRISTFMLDSVTFSTVILPKILQNLFECISEFQFVFNHIVKPLKESIKQLFWKSRGLTSDLYYKGRHAGGECVEDVGRKVSFQIHVKYVKVYVILQKLQIQNSNNYYCVKYTFCFLWLLCI